MLKRGGEGTKETVDDYNQPGRRPNGYEREAKLTREPKK